MQNQTALPADLEFKPRHELKYYISHAGHAHLSALLRNVLWGDPNGDENSEYRIRSLYFDDAYDRAYYEKMDGVSRRSKYRIRIYNNSDELIFLERKRKIGSMIGKSSVRITRRLCDQLISGRTDGLSSAQAPLLQDYYREMRLNVLRPVVIVDYLREVYIHPVENVRITFDKFVRSGMFHRDLFDPELPLVPVMESNRMIMEVKYDSFLPDYIGRLLSTVPAEHSAISKYVFCRRYHGMNE